MELRLAFPGPRESMPAVLEEQLRDENVVVPCPLTQLNAQAWRLMKDAIPGTVKAMTPCSGA